MATLPEGRALPATLITEDEPSLTWYIDKSSNRIQGTCDNFIATKQAVEISLNTERFKWQIYEPSSGTDYSGLIGQDSGYVAIELQRRVKEALLMDTRVLNISDFTYTANDGILMAEFVVNTVYGSMNESVEVNTR